MTAIADQEESPLFCIVKRIRPAAQAGAVLDNLFMLRMPNVIATSNFTIPYISQTQNEDPVVVALKIFGFINY